MKLWKKIVLAELATVVLLVILLAMLPAKLVVDQLDGRVGPAELREVSGTIWNGSAQRTTVHGQELGALSWQVHPLALLGARIDTDLQLKGEQYQGSGFASVAREQVTLRAVQIEFPAERLQATLDVPALVPHGRVAVQLDEAELLSGFPRSLKGHAIWRDARVSGQAEALLGDLRADFASAGGGVKGTVKDQGGPLVLAGQFELAFSGFKAEAELRAREDNRQVRDALRWIGQVQPDGSSKLLIEGKILPVSR